MWKQKKAQIVSYPKEVLVGKPGEILFADIEVENAMHWPWKEGATLQDDFSDLTKQVLDVVSLPIDFPVPENSKFKMCIPIKIKNDAVAGEQIYEANFNFHGRKGNFFGDKIPIKIQIKKAYSDMEYFTLGMSIFEEQPQKSFDFQEIVSILRDCGNDKEKCRQIMAEKQAMKSNLIQEENNMNF